MEPLQISNEQLNKRLDRIEKLLLGQKEILNLEETSEFTGLSRAYIYKLSSLGQIPKYKPRNGQLYFKRTEIEAWLLRNKTSSQDEIDMAADQYLLRQNK